MKPFSNIKAVAEVIPGPGLVRSLPMMSTGTGVEVCVGENGAMISITIARPLYSSVIGKRERERERMSHILESGDKPNEVSA